MYNYFTLLILVKVTGQE